MTKKNGKQQNDEFEVSDTAKLDYSFLLRCRIGHLGFHCSSIVNYKNLYTSIRPSESKWRYNHSQKS